MSTNGALVVGIGLRSEQEDFIKRHRLFFDRFPNLKKAFADAFLRKVSSTEKTDMIVFLLGRLCLEDFNEILVLSGNGYGIGALKILRGLYEKTVTASYLHKHPEATNDFLDFFWVNQHRLAEAIKDNFGDEALPKEKLGEDERMYAQVRERFMVTDCKKCGTRRLNYTWSKLDFVSMTREVGELGKSIIPAYYLPTQQAHSTVRSILARIKEVEDEEFTFVWEAQRDEADEALRYGHTLSLAVLELQKEHFKLTELQEALTTCIKDFHEIWLSDSEVKDPSAAL